MHLLVVLTCMASLLYIIINSIIKRHVSLCVKELLLKPMFDVISFIIILNCMAEQHKNPKQYFEVNS